MIPLSAQRNVLSLYDEYLPDWLPSSLDLQPWNIKQSFSETRNDPLLQEETLIFNINDFCWFVLLSIFTRVTNLFFFRQILFLFLPNPMHMLYLSVTWPPSHLSSCLSPHVWLWWCLLYTPLTAPLIANAEQEPLGSGTSRSLSPFIGSSWFQLLLILILVMSPHS